MNTWTCGGVVLSALLPADEFFDSFSELASRDDYSTRWAPWQRY